MISTRSWKRVPTRHHGALLAAVRDVARTAEIESRRAGEQAITEMRARGLTVVAVDAANRAEWLREARAAYPALRESIGFPKLFDEVLRLAAEYKKANPGGAALDRTRRP